MTIYVSLKDAENRLSELARLMENGERVIVTRRGKPAFEMVAPHRGGVDLEGLARWKKERGLQLVAGPIPDDFDEPLPEDFLITPIRCPNEAGQA